MTFETPTGGVPVDIATVSAKGKAKAAAKKATPTPKPTQVEDPPSTGRQLPPGKVYGTFASHKKQHSVFADASEVRGSSFDLFESTNL